LNDLNIFDRSFEKNLVRKYGAENYAIVQMALGNSVTELIESINMELAS
jgi:hypothetical protein